MLTDGHWLGVRDGDPRARALYLRHYSCQQYRDGRRIPGTKAFVRQYVGPGEYMAFITLGCDALFVWRKKIRHEGKRIKSDDDQEGINCSVFRNEGPILSSELIREADVLAFQRWPGERHYTYVNDRKVQSGLPGACFLAAGWRYVRVRGHRYRSKSGLLLLEKLSEEETLG